MSKLQVIIASTRPRRAADTISTWVINRAKEHEHFEVEVLDLREWALPMFAEDPWTVGDRENPTYSDEKVRAWNETIRRADAYVFVTPEYNHSIPGALKNAIESVYMSNAFRNKPAVFVGYSGSQSGGIRAIEHLALIAIDSELMPLRTTVIVPFVGDAFDENANPKNPATEATLKIALDDLAWWSNALEKARADGELLPANTRLQKALAAK